MNATTALHPAPPAAIESDLIALLGVDRVVLDKARRVFFSTDIGAEGATAECVIRPGSTELLAQAVALCTARGRTVIPRGGGFSYTGGYRPESETSVIVDLRDLDRVVEINADDMYVVVETGCTWKTLYDALKKLGLRTPYFGPMSGFSATVGGALSQGSFFLGSTQHGTVAESVLAVEVVLADGRVVRTGSWGGTNDAGPFYRWYGPDLTGVFLSDTGALGLKTKAVLKLIPFPPHQRYATFAFETVEPALRLVSEVGRKGLASECYCWDPVFVKSIGERSGMLQNLRYLRGVVGSGSSLLQGLKDAAKIARAGRSIFDGDTYLVHAVIDEVTEAGAEARLRVLQAAAADCGGGEIEASAPRTTRGTPFTDFNTSGFAATGARNLPVNALCAHSRAQDVLRQVNAFFAANKTVMEFGGVTHGTILFAVGSTAVCIEPIFFWTDQQHKLHDRVAEQSDLDALSAFDGKMSAPARLVMTLRAQLIDLFRAAGCVHAQIGRSYPYRQTRQADALSLIEAIKAAVDPDGLVNTGSLGL